MRLFCVRVVLCVGREALRRADPPVQGVLPTVYKIKKLKKWARSNKSTVEPIDIVQQNWNSYVIDYKGKVDPVIN
jgi:hypothetical protein